MFKIRQIKENDAAAFLELTKTIDVETPFMLRETGERKTTVEEQEKRIQEIFKTDNQTIFLAESDGRLVGYLMAHSSQLARLKRTAQIVIGILKAFQGQGIGKMLFEALEKWARSKKIHRLELDVIVPNERAINLYKKMGFVIEGTKKENMFVDGAFVDTYIMAKILS